MGLHRWTGSGYEDVSPAKHRASGQYVDRTLKAAYVWEGGQYKEVWPAYREEIVRYTSVGSHSIELPSWCREVDFLLLGGGGGGDRGNSGNNTGGGGGLAGSWGMGTLAVSGPGQISVEVGRGGNGTSGSAHDHTDGKPTRIFDKAGQLIKSAPGGARGSGSYSVATSPGTRTYAGMTIVGGGTSAVNETGKVPGGGGGGGNGGIFGIFNVGRPGGRGEAIIRFRSGPLQ